MGKLVPRWVSSLCDQKDESSMRKLMICVGNFGALGKFCNVPDAELSQRTKVPDAQKSSRRRKHLRRERFPTQKIVPDAE